MMSLAIKVKAASRAMIMATAVNRPKSIVGMKFDRTRIENPTVIVIVV
mgnify:CR=1 FL=1